jgi:transcriptional regulator with XRE-family HTH domain
MSVGIQSSPISEDELLEDYYDNLHEAHSSMQAAFRLRQMQGLTQDQIALRLGADKGLISRRLNGSENLTLKTLSYMGSAMNCRVIVTYRLYEFDSLFDDYPQKIEPANPVEHRNPDSEPIINPNKAESSLVPA